MRPGEAWRRFRYFLGRDRLSAELREEMRLHMELRESQLVEAGMDPREAAAQARKEFGNETVLAERSREQWGWSWVDSLLRDLRYAFRQLRRGPVFAIGAIATLGLGIGATTAIFSVVNGVLLREPAGVTGFDRLVAIYTSDSSGQPYSAEQSLPDLRDFESGVPALSGVAAYERASVILSDDSGTEPADMVLGQVVTPTYFQVVGARTTVGRAFAAGEGTAGGRSDVVVLSHEFWRRRFGGDPSIVGETVTLAGTSYTVVGVAEQGFYGLLPTMMPAAFFVPVGAPGISDSVDRRSSRGFRAVGRLAEGATIDQARTQLEAVAAGLHDEYPEAWTDARNQPRAVTLIAAREAIVPPQIRGLAFGFAALLMAIVGGVLLIGCANIANLLLARAIGRRREIGIRLAIGARRGRVVRQMLTESTVLAGFGALFGLVIALIGTRALALVPAFVPLPIALRLEITPDLRVLGFATAVTVLAGLLSGLAPALLATRRNLISSLRREESGGRRLGLRAVLAAGQIAIAMVLLAAGGLLLRSLIEAQAVDPGFQTNGLLSVSTALDVQSTSEERLRIRNEIVERIGALPGVSSASYVTWLPLGASGGGRRTYRAERYTPAETEDLAINTSDAGPDFFQTIGTRLVRGREFAPADRIGVSRFAIVNEEFVRRYLQGVDPLGRRLLSRGDSLTVVGVVEDGKYRSLGEDPQPFVWRAADQWPSAEDALTIVVRAGADAGTLARPVRQIVADAAPNVAITGMLLGDQHLSSVLAPRKFGAWLLGLFGALGLGLAALGIYSVMAYAVSQRTREFGIRLALGARTADITRMVLGQGMVVCAIGGAVGLALAAGATRLMQFLLFDVTPLDPVTFGAVIVLIFAVTLLANWLPALRTAKTDPLESLRFD